MGRTEGVCPELILGLFETEGFSTVGSLLPQNMRVLGGLRVGCLSRWGLWVLICSHSEGQKGGRRCDRSLGDSGFQQSRVPCQVRFLHSLYPRKKCSPCEHKPELWRWLGLSYRLLHPWHSPEVWPVKSQIYPCLHPRLCTKLL